MKKIHDQMQELRLTGIAINGVRYVPYNVFMWFIRQSTHINQLVKKQEKYPAHFITVNDAPYVTERYARYILLHQQSLEFRQSLLSQVNKSDLHYIKMLENALVNLTKKGGDNEN